MTLTLFMGLLLIFAVVVSLITEAVKKYLQDMKLNYSANLVVLIIAIIVGAGGTALVYMFRNIPFTTPNIVCMGLMAVAVWVGSMVGYDKIIQMLEQFQNLKAK